MITPLKRHVHLQPLSRDHHQGLLLCFKIREGFKRDVVPERIKRYTDWFWEHHLAEHFRVEEKYVFPILGTEHELIRQAMDEHQRLTSLFNRNDALESTLRLIEVELEKHIRFEERVLFNEIQRVATPEQLAVCEQKHNTGATCEPWKDEFWKR
jgi:iron-sulfur cluster repair protein YtfE (RIC family)